tara:strand:- start:130 stop:444 length:315 start_codon:yes stop_codon:yes gene_type:complete
MAQVIDLTKELNRRAEKRLEKIKEELEIELQRLDFDMEKEINKYVIFDTSRYYELIEEKNQREATYEEVVKLLLNASRKLLDLSQNEASMEIENVITRLKNQSY